MANEQSEPMQSNQDGRRAMLVLHMTSGTATLGDKEIELPLREFRLLAALAERPRESLPLDALKTVIWAGEDPEFIPDTNFYTLMRKLRRKLKEAECSAEIRNRRGFGYSLDIDPSEVHFAQPGDLAPPLVEPASAIESARDDDADEDINLEEERSAANEASIPAAEGRSNRSIGAAALIAALVAGSWGAGYVLAARDQAPAPQARVEAPYTPPPTPAVEGKTRNKAEREDRRNNDKPRRSHRQGPSKARQQESAPVVVAAPLGEGSGTQSQTASTSEQPAPAAPKRKAPPPSLPAPPTRYLYHLIHPDTGDHFVTVDSSTASEYQAKGYRGSAIARVYTAQEQGTRALTTNAGTAWIFVDGAPRTEPASQPVPLWYSTNNAGDFFYTTSQSEARASGWSGSLVGYARAL